MGRQAIIKAFDQKNLVVLVNEIDRLWEAIGKTDTSTKKVNRDLSELQQVVLVGSGVVTEKRDSGVITIPTESLGAKHPSMDAYYPSTNSLRYGRVLLSWADWPGILDSRVISYDVFITSDSGCLANDDNLYATGIRGSKMVISGLSDGSTYYTRVRPNTSEGIGLPSKVVSFTTPEGVMLAVSTSDPSAIGDIKIVSAAEVEIDDCDALTNWSVLSGSATLSINKYLFKEGTGCLEVTVAPGITNTVQIKCTVSPTDIHSNDYLRVWLLPLAGMNSLVAFKLYFGESTYNEQSKSISVYYSFWNDISWDISLIGAAARDAVTLFVVECRNDTEYEQKLFIDFVRAMAVGEALKVKFASGVKTVTVT